MIAISYRALVFHAQVRGFNQFIPIFIKRIRAKPMFKGFKHRLYVGRKLLFGFFQVVGSTQ
jgi:hypothetical protein